MQVFEQIFDCVTQARTHTHTHTHTNTNMQTNNPHKINFKKPGMCQPVASAPGLKTVYV